MTKRIANKFGGLAIVVTLAMAAPLAAQPWSTGFFNTNDGWVEGAYVTGQNTNDIVADRWQGNDPENEVSPGVFVGGTDYIQFVSGYTPIGSATGNRSLIQGGLNIATGYIPGTNSVSIWRSFTPLAVGPTGTASFRIEWSLIGSLDPSFPNADTFSFQLRDESNTTSLLSMQLTPGINIQPNSYTLQSLAAGAPTNTLADLGYQAVYQLQVDMTGSNYNAELWQINSATRAVITNLVLATAEPLAGGTSAEDFGTFALNWDLESGNAADPGSNYIIVNEVSVVPEPSSYALLALAGTALALFAIRRRRA